MAKGGWEYVLPARYDGHTFFFMRGIVVPILQVMREILSMFIYPYHPGISTQHLNTLSWSVPSLHTVMSSSKNDLKKKK